MPNEETVGLTGRLIAEFEEEANPDPDLEMAQPAAAPRTNGAAKKLDSPKKPAPPSS